MRVHFSLPIIKLLPNYLNLGQIEVGSTAQGVVTIENISASIGCSLSTNKIFSVNSFLLSDWI